MKLKDGKALIRINSHRAREKIERLLGYLPKCYFSFFRRGEWREVSPEELLKIKEAKIKGISQSAWKDDLLMCWQ